MADIQNDANLLVRYEVKFQQAMECGGAYVKLLSDLESLDLVGTGTLFC